MSYGKRSLSDFPFLKFTFRCRCCKKYKFRCKMVCNMGSMQTIKELRLDFSFHVIIPKRFFLYYTNIFKHAKCSFFFICEKKLSVSMGIHNILLFIWQNNRRSTHHTQRSFRWNTFDYFLFCIYLSIFWQLFFHILHKFNIYL